MLPRMNHECPVFPADIEPAGLYLHVPFCTSRCNYCAFVTNLHDPDLESDYMRWILKEMEIWNRAASELGLIEHVEFDSIYVGGGTPSVLSAGLLSRLVDACFTCFAITERPEVTVEVNPATLAVSGMKDLTRAGVNRVSLGIQSLHDAELRIMGRRHTAHEALKAFDDLRSAGFDNISVDLMAGFPHQSRTLFRETVEKIMDLQPEHLSVYLLEVKEGTRLEALIRAEELPPVDDDLVADMYEDVRRLAQASGYVHYEISNYARNGWLCRHNLKYWTDAIYIGLGPGAHGMTGRHRYANCADITEYGSALEANVLPLESVSELTPMGRFKDALIMGARLVQGVDLKVLGERYGVNARDFVERTVGDLEPAGLFHLDSHRLILTSRGLLLSNVLFSRWL